MSQTMDELMAMRDDEGPLIPASELRKIIDAAVTSAAIRLQEATGKVEEARAVLSNVERLRARVETLIKEAARY